MSRVVGFSLKLEGSTATIAEINKIEKALQGISEQINSTKKLNLGVLKPLFEGQEQLSKAISETNKVLSAQSKILSNLGTSKNVDSTIVDNLQKTVTKLRSEITKLQEELKDLKTPKVAVPTPEGFDKITAETKKIIEDIKKIAPVFDQLASGTAASFLNKITDIDIKLKAVKENITKAKQAGSTDNSENLTQLVAAEKALKIEKAKTVALLKEEEKQFIATSKAIDPTSVIGMREELSRLKAEYLKLSEAERNSAEGQKKFNAIVAQNNNISTIEQSLGDFRRNVGNYRDAVNGLVPTLLNLQKQGFAANQGLLDTFKNENRSKVDALEKEINQLSAAYAKLTAEERKADVGVKLLNKLNTQADELNRSLRTLPNEVSGLKKSFIGIGDIITGGLITGGILAAVSSIKAFGTESIKEFSEAQVALGKVNAQLAATGNQAGISAKELKKLADSIEVNTGIDADTVLNEVTSGLLKFVRIQGDVFKQAQQNAVDLAQVMGGDLAGATQLLGKALDDPIRGISILRKAGISLDADTKKQIETAVKANDTYKAQTIILREVEGRVKGVSSAINNTDLNGVRNLTVAWNNAKEAVGEALISIGNGIIDLYKSFSDGTILVPTGMKETTRAINELGEAVAKEETQITSGIRALKDQNLNNDVRKKIIEQIAEKYGDLVTKEELEAATIEDLNRLQVTLTDTVKKQVFARIKLASQEAIATEIAQNQIKQAFLKRQDDEGLSFGDKFKLALAKLYYGQKIAYTGFAIKTEENIKNLKAEMEKNEIILNEAFPEINTTKIQLNYKDAALKIKGVLLGINNALSDKTISDTAKKRLLELNNEFSGIKIDSKASDEYIKSVVERSNKANNLIASLSKKTIGAISDESEAIKKSSEEARKKIEEQLQQINELNKRIEDLRINAIDNEFDQRIEKVRASTRQEIEETKEKYKTQQALVKELIQKLGEAELNEITKINNERSKVLNEAVQELTILQKDVDVILNASVQADIEEKIKQFAFELSQQERTIQINYDTNLEDLKAQLANGLISTKDFEEQSKILDKKRLDSQLVSAQKYNDTVSGIYDDLLATQLLVVEATKERAKYEAEIEATKKRVSIEQDLKSGKIDLGTADSLIVEQHLNTEAKLHQIEQKAIQDSNELERVNLKNKQDAADKVVALNKSAQEEITANELKEQDKRKENLQAVKDGAIELARITADAISQINQNQADRDYNRNIDNLEREKNARLKLVKGNTAEEERINREYDIKKRKLDEENFKRQQRAAILQATINGALGATAVFAVPDFTFGIKSAIQLGIILANTIAQIAIIKSQSFAEGGFAKKEFRRPGEGGMTGASIAPKDHTGKRPVGVATYHENEYTMPDWQVEMHEELAKAMDKDRATKSNYHVNLYYRKMAMKAIENYENNPGILRRKPEPRTIPFIYQPRHIQKESSKVEMSEEVIDRIAETIATKAEQAITKGVNKGYAQSVKEITQDELRKQQRELKKAM